MRYLERARNLRRRGDVRGSLNGGRRLGPRVAAESGLPRRARRRGRRWGRGRRRPGRLVGDEALGAVVEQLDGNLFEGVERVGGLRNVDGGAIGSTLELEGRSESLPVRS